MLTNISPASSDTSEFSPRNLDKISSTSFSLPTLAYRTYFQGYFVQYK